MVKSPLDATRDWRPHWIWHTRFFQKRQTFKNSMFSYFNKKNRDISWTILKLMMGSYPMPKCRTADLFDQKWGYILAQRTHTSFDCRDSQDWHVFFLGRIPKFSSSNQKRSSLRYLNWRHQVFDRQIDLGWMDNHSHTLLLCSFFMGGS